MAGAKNDTALSKSECRKVASTLRTKWISQASWHAAWCVLLIVTCGVAALLAWETRLYGFAFSGGVGVVIGGGALLMLVVHIRDLHSRPDREFLWTAGVSADEARHDESAPSGNLT